LFIDAVTSYVPITVDVHFFVCCVYS